MILGLLAALAVPGRAGLGHADRPSRPLTRPVITLILTCVAAYTGSAALGSATAVLTRGPAPAHVEVWATSGVTSLDLDVTVGAVSDWEADPAFVTGPVVVEIDVEGVPGESGHVVLAGDTYFETSGWDSVNDIVEVDAREYVGASRVGDECLDTGITSIGGFTSARALMVKVPITDAGTGHARLSYTDDRQWWRGSADRSEVTLPSVDFAPAGSCAAPAPGHDDAWFVPPTWSVVEQAGQPNLEAGDIVVVPRVPDARSELWEDRPAARWTAHSTPAGVAGGVSPAYRLETVNTRTRATTYSFAAALMLGLALTGVVDLVRVEGSPALRRHRP